LLEIILVITVTSSPCSITGRNPTTHW